MIDGFVGYTSVAIDSVKPYQRFRWYGQWYQWAQMRDGRPIARKLEPNESHGEPQDSGHSILPGMNVEVVWSPDADRHQV